MVDHPGPPEDASAPTGDPPLRARNIGELAAHLLALAGRDPEAWARRVNQLTVREQAELALHLPADKRAELVLHSPRPMRLVRALPDVDLYLTVREIGPADAGPLLALASTEQLLHLIDLESWRGDRFDADRCGSWVALLVESGEPALKRFLKWADEELLALLFQRWMRVQQMEYEDGAQQHGHGQGDAGDEEGMPTPDGEHRFKPSIPEHAPAIQRILRLFYVEMRERYQQVLWNSLWELSAELEERALHWRQSRLEEHGFPRWEEAISVYASPVGTTAHPTPIAPVDPDGLLAARTPVLVLSADQPLSVAVAGLDDAGRERLLHEWISLSNHLLVADRGDTGDPRAHRATIDKVAAFVRIALEARDAVDPTRARELLDRVPMMELFREGWAHVGALRELARWLADDANLFDSPIRERIETLLGERPLYLPAIGETPREFHSLREVEETRVSLEVARSSKILLVERLGFDAHHPSLVGGEPDGSRTRLSTLLLTLLGWHAVRGELRGEALPAEVAATFLRNVASRRTAPPDAAERALERLLEALGSQFELSPRENSVLHGYGRFCLVRLAEECGALDPGVPIDARFVGCLLVEPSGSV